ncbi:MAG TPA: GNAT family N-acetyltransferase [Polyangiaceae bacterium]|nr:GNAT family N-acetyltransferase [Polyangiaceae bacterium]
MEPRLLLPADAALLEAFLAQHRDSSMFLRSNARHGGLVDRGKYLQATYVGCFHDGALVGVAAHCWNGMLLVQAPGAGLAETVCAAVKHSRRGVNGFSGPLDQIRAARRALALDQVPTQLEEQESLFALQLSELSVPEALRDGSLQCRPPLPQERQLLGDWRLGFDIESLNVKPSESARKRAGESVDAQIAAGNAWVVIAGGAPVSYSAFNAALPDIVQLGGIYTPPEQRNRGYARAAVAGSLLAARARGVTRAVLFTKNPSAMRAYEAVGFRRIGEYGLVLLARPAPSGPASS